MTAEDDGTALSSGSSPIHGDLQEILLSEKAIRGRIEVLGAAISSEYKENVPFFLSVLKGSVIFLADLVRAIHIPCEFGFVTISTYQGETQPSREPETLERKLPDLAGRHVVLVEDILDSGKTLAYAVKRIREAGAASVKTCVLVAKEGYRDSVFPEPDYLGFEIPRRFVVGYGLDYRERYRNLRYIGVLKPERIEG